MISLSSSGSFKNTLNFCNKMSDSSIFSALEKYGREGVVALAAATPTATGVTANAWSYEVTRTGNSWSISWHNSHTVAGTPVVILLQYGHGTGTGGYVEGRDFINPAIQPIFDRIADEVWKVVTSA